MDDKILARLKFSSTRLSLILLLEYTGLSKESAFFLCFAFRFLIFLSINSF